MIFSSQRGRETAPVNFTKNREISKSMIFQRRSMIFLWLGMIFCGIFGMATFGCGAAFALESSANFSVIVPGVNTLEITLSDSNLVLNLTPQMAEASFGSKDLTITVGTSNLAGYNLMMNTSSTALTSAAENTIESLDEDEDGYTCTDASCNFTLNRWGFKKSTDATYNYIPASISIASNDEPTNGEDTTINFASRVDAQQPAGTYSTTLTFIATVNPTSMTINDIDTLQDFASLAAVDYADVIDSMEMETNYTKKDARDDQDYTIAKLKDGKIWMTKNLNLAGGTEITSELSDIPENYTLPTANGFQSGNKLPASSTSGFSSDTTAYVYNSGNATDNCASPGCYSYYSWTAATAGSGVNITTDNTDAPYSICPKGWKLPNTRGTTYDDSSDFRVLMAAYGGSSAIPSYATSTDPTGATMYSKISASPVPNFLLAGYYRANSFYSGNSGGYYWSSTASSSESSREIFFTSEYVDSAGSIDSKRGVPVRCILDQTLAQQNVVYMQDFATMDTEKRGEVLASMATEKTYTLKDKRDNQEYTVAKLKDGKIWMTKNLNLAGGTAISAADTNVSSDYINDFYTSNNLTKTNGTIVLPASNTSGFNTDNYSYVYNSNGTTCGNNSPCYSYYSWDAATLGSGRSITTDNTDAEYSICPRGWRLPSTYNGTDAETDFRALIIAYGGSSTVQNYNASSSPTGSTIYTQIIVSPAPDFLPVGYYNSDSFSDGGSRGQYWSSTSSSSASARNLRFNSVGVGSADGDGRRRGFAVRCILDETFYFTVGSFDYKAINGMTWAQWVGSSYSNNSSGYAVSFSVNRNASSGKKIQADDQERNAICYINGEPDDIIEANGIYTYTACDPQDFGGGGDYD